MEGERLIRSLFTDKLGARSLEVGRDCLLDKTASANPLCLPRPRMWLADWIIGNGGSIVVGGTGPRP